MLSYGVILLQSGKGWRGSATRCVQSVQAHINKWAKELQKFNNTVEVFVMQPTSTHLTQHGELT